MQRMASQKMESITTDPYQQNILDQTQNELNQELKSLRNNHSNLIQEKTHDLNNLNVMIENYQKLMKKIHDENQFLLDESKKIEEKKNFAIKTILSFQNNLDMLLNKNLEIKQKIITQSSNAIDQITETATNTLNQLNQTSKNSYSESSNLTLMQRKQMFQEERDRERVRYEENLAKPQQFPKNFDVDMTQIESNIGNNDNLIKNKENNVNSFGINNIIQDIPLKNDNQMNNLNNNHLNNQNVSNFNNDMQLNNSNNFNLQTENPQNNQNYNISHEMQKSLNNSNESPQKAQEINNKMALTIKNIGIITFISLNRLYF